MSITGSVMTTRWDAGLDPTNCDRYNNAEITLHLRVCLQQLNPAGGAARGQVRDAGRTNRDVMRWTTASWNNWKRRYQREVQRYWHGRFWLIPPSNFTELDYEDQGARYRPNVWCRFRIRLVERPGGAHHTIQVVRLAPTTSFFRSHSRLYDSGDLSPREHGANTQLTHVHEVGHLLGLGHSAEHRPECTDTGDTNSPVCYGTTAEEREEIMGGGSALREWHAQPWRQAMQRCTGAPAVTWVVSTRRSYPRTEEDIAARRFVARRPRRG